MLGAFCDCADGWLQIQFRGMNFDFFSGMYGAEPGDRMSGIGNSKLAAQSGGGNAGMIVRDVCDLPVYTEDRARCATNRGPGCRVQNR